MASRTFVGGADTAGPRRLRLIKIRRPWCRRAYLFVTPNELVMPSTPTTLLAMIGLVGAVRHVLLWPSSWTA